MKMQNKWFTGLGIAICVAVAMPELLSGMEKEYGFEVRWTEAQLPKEVQHIIRSKMAEEAVNFLASQPRYTLKGHTGPIVIADDKVITGSSANTVKVWNIKTGKLQHTLEGHTGWVSSIVIGDDRVVTGSRDRTAKVWDLKTGKLLHSLEGHTDFVDSIAIAGDRVVTGSWDHTAKIWDTKTGKLLHTLEGHTAPVSSVVIADDRVVTGSWDHTAKVWDIETGKLLYTLEGHAGSVYSVVIADDNNRVVTGSYDNTAKIWDIKTGKLQHTLEGHTAPVFSVAIAGDRLVTGSNDDTAKIWDIKTGMLLHTLEGHIGAVRFVMIGDGKVVVTGSNDNTAKVWDLKTGKLLHTFAHPPSVYSVGLGHKVLMHMESVAIAGDKVATWSTDRTIKIWDLKPFAGTPETNPLLWIVYNATIPQIDLITRACEATRAWKDFVITLISEDAKVFLSLPAHIRLYLLDRLNIKLYDPKPQSSCTIQ